MATARKGEASGSGSDLQRAIEPAVVGGLHAGRAGLHVILRIEMRARGIRRTRGVHDGQLLLLEKRQQRRQAGMQAEKAVEIERGAFAALPRLRNRDGRADAVVIRLARKARRCSIRRPRRAGRARRASCRSGPAVAATARCRNAGSVLMPIMATPPLFRNARRETAMVFSFVYAAPICRAASIMLQKSAGRVPALLKR